MTAEPGTPPAAGTEFPISVIMERQPVADNPWVNERWAAVAVVAGAHMTAGGRERTRLRSDAGAEQYLWRGFALELFRDDAVSYYSNLMGEQPGVFVVCRDGDDDGDELVPLLVTVSYDEAASYLETDEPVFRVPMPPEVYRWLERYVVENYIPEKPKKRRRVDWKAEGGAT